MPIFSVPSSIEFCINIEFNPLSHIGIIYNTPCSSLWKLPTNFLSTPFHGSVVGRLRTFHTGVLPYKCQGEFTLADMTAYQPQLHIANNVTGMVHYHPRREFSCWLVLNALLLNVEGLTSANIYLSGMVDTIQKCHL